MIELQDIDEYVDFNDSEYFELDYLNKLRKVSPLVDEYFINNAYYNECGRDNYTVSDLVLIAFNIIIEELRDIGIYIDSSMYLGDYVSMDKVYTFRKVFDPVTFRMTLANTTNLNTDISNYLDSVINEPDEILISDILSDVLEIMSLVCVSNSETYKLLFQCSRDNITCTEAFLTYLQAAIADSEYISKSNLFGDITLTSQYIKNIYDGRVYFNIAMEFLLSKFAIPKTELIQHLIRNYDLDKVQPDVVKFFAYLDDDSKSIDDFPDSAKKLYTEYIINRHHKTAMHHYEYWESRNIQVTDRGIIAALVAHYYKPNKPIDVLLNDITPLKRIMSSDNYTLAIRMAKLLATL